MPDQHHEWVSVSEASRRLGRSVSTIRRQIETGELVGERLEEVGAFGDVDLVRGHVPAEAQPAPQVARVNAERIGVAAQIGDEHPSHAALHAGIAAGAHVQTPGNIGLTKVALLAHAPEAGAIELADRVGFRGHGAHLHVKARRTRTFQSDCNAVACNVNPTVVYCTHTTCELSLGGDSQDMRSESQVKRAPMSNITIRVPDELIDRIREIAARDYSREAAVVRRLIRLGIEADQRREQVDAPREMVGVAS